MSETASSDPPPQLLGATAIRPVERTPWEKFKHFLYDREKGAFLYRTPKSWLFILLFYVIFYTCLMAFWFSMLQIVLNTLDENHPRYIGHNSIIGLQPGLAVKPQQSMAKVGSSLIYIRGDWNGRKADKLEEESDAGYVTRLAKYLDEYSSGSLIACSEEDLQLPREPGRLPCRYDTSKYGPCAMYPFGYIKEDLEPCIFVKLNKVFGFEPKPLDARDLLDKDLRTHIPAEIKALIADAMEPPKIYITCDGVFPADKEALEGNVEYFPKDRGIAPGYFPYRVKYEFVSPGVAMKFRGIPRGQLIHIECRAWYKGVKHNVEEGISATKFQFLIDAPKDS